MALLVYVSHPEVVIDPSVPVPDWGLTEHGRSRAKEMVRGTSLAEVRRVVTSPETKAIETAELLATHLGLSPEVRAATAEIDRSATGYVPADRHEELADRLFAEPMVSASGWERAVDAQARVADCLADVLVDGPDDVAVVGHGGVGTLLMCRLAGWEIARGHDQPTAGCCWVFDRRTERLVHAWRRFEELA